MTTLNVTNLKNPSSGSNNIVLDAAGGATFQQIKGGALTLATAVASTSGTSIDFTGIPSWVKRVTVMFAGVSTNGASALLVQLGTSGGIETTSYNSTAVITDGAALATTSSTTGVVINTYTASDAKSGYIQFCTLGSNAWVFNGLLRTAATQTSTAMGSKTLSSTLDRIRITTVNGTDTFDAGTISILYEG